MTIPPDQSAAASCRLAGQSKGSESLSATFAADRAFPAAVAELGRSVVYHDRSMIRTIVLSLVLLMIAGCSTSKDQQADSHSEESSSMASHELADKTVDRILKHYGDTVDPSKMPVAHRTVLVVYQAHGILGNGGFQYLFEGDFPGDPEFLITRQAHKTIGATKASEAFQKAFAVFPNSTPPDDIEERLKIWQSHYTLQDAITTDDSPDAMYLSAMDDVMEKLNAYIIAHESEFATLE